MTVDLAQITAHHDLQLAEEGDSKARERVRAYMGDDSIPPFKVGRPDIDSESQYAFELRQAMRKCCEFETMPRSNKNDLIARATGAPSGPAVKKRIDKVAKQVERGEYVPLENRSHVGRDVILIDAYVLLTGKEPPPELFQG